VASKKKQLQMQFSLYCFFARNFPVSLVLCKKQIHAKKIEEGR
jgi:hypothetical protein